MSDAAASSSGPRDDGLGGAPPAHAANPRTGSGERYDHLLRSLLELSRDLTVSLDLFDVTDLLLFNLMGQVGGSRAALWLTSERDGVLTVVRCHGFNRSFADGAMVAHQEGLLARLGEDAMRPRRWLRTESLDPEAFKLIHQARIALLAPLRSRDELIGWIALGHRVDGAPYGHDELEVLETALGMVGMALENTRLFNRVREANRSLTTANEHLQELDRLKSEFLDHVNHELRTPLAVVMGAIECVLETLGVDEPSRRLLQTALESSHNLGAIIENLLLWSECTSDRVVLAITENEVAPIVERVCRLRLPGITEDLRELQVDLAADLGSARFDAHRLTQILNELIDNAVKFTPRGTRLRVRGRAEHDGAARWVRIEVQDNGPGIPADRLQSLFRGFEQVDGSMTRRAGGLGLGLAFAHALAERMGGGLDVTSRVGMGTTFTLRLPAVEARAEGTARAA